MKTMNFLSVFIVLVLIQSGCQPQLDQCRSNLDPAVESKIDILLAKMTLEEKVGQMSQRSKHGEDGPKDTESFFTGDSSKIDSSLIVVF